ncbi:MAG: hypothetical protein HOO96_25290 [Polyangiaceae bacterium]|nr:hypothetical protein [Polyangiaceae bacterium]
MSQLRTTSLRVPIVVKVFVTFLHGLMFAVGLTVLGVVSAASILDADSELARYGRMPSASETAAGRIWFDAPIQATVPLKGDADPWHGCRVERQRYSQGGKTAAWFVQTMYSHAAAEVRVDGQARRVPLYSVNVPDSPGVVLSRSEAQARMGSDFVDSDFAGIERRTAQHGAVRYVEKCVKAGQWLFFDGTLEGSTFRPKIAEVGSGPSLQRRRLAFVNLHMAGATAALVSLFYAIALVFVWGAPLSLVNVLRRRAHLAEQSEVSWTTLVLVSLSAVVGAASGGAILHVPLAATVPAILGSVFLCLLFFARARRRALLSIPPGELHEACVVPSDVAVTTPMLAAPVAAWLLEVFRIGAKNSQTKVATLDSRTPIRVRFVEPSGPGEVEVRDAAMDLPAIDVQRSGVELDVLKLPGVPVDITGRYRLRESALPVRSPVMVVGKRDKQLSHRAEDAAGDTGYREPGFESVVRSTEIDRVVIIEGSRASFTERTRKDAMKLRAVGIVAAVGVVLSAASLATSLILATRM